MSLVDCDGAQVLEITKEQGGAMLTWYHELWKVMPCHAREVLCCERGVMLVWYHERCQNKGVRW